MLQDAFKLTVMSMNVWSSCFHLLSAGIIGVLGTNRANALLAELYPQPLGILPVSPSHAVYPPATPRLVIASPASPGLVQQWSGSFLLDLSPDVFFSP